MADKRQTELSAEPHDGEIYRHKKRGGLYSVVGVGSLQTSEPLTDGAALVVYRGQDGRLWVRPADEFSDGRFERKRDDDDAHTS